MEKANNNTDFKGLFKDPKTKNFTLWVVGLTVLMIIVFLGINQLLCIKDFGQLGDFFNGIAAPVLALITIVLLYNSFLVQKEELKAATKAIALNFWIVISTLFKNSRKHNLLKQ